MWCAAQGCIVLILVFVAPTENWSFGLILGIGTVITFLMVQVHARPYTLPAANRVEESSLGATALTWGIGLHFYNDEPINEAWKLDLATALILFVNIMYARLGCTWIGDVATV